MPQFDKQFYSDTVPENIELHSPLNVLIQATSPMSRKLIYSIVKGNELEEFAVYFNTGMQEFFSYHFICLSIEIPTTIEASPCLHFRHYVISVFSFPVKVGVVSSTSVLILLSAFTENDGSLLSKETRRKNSNNPPTQLPSIVPSVKHC